MDWSLKNKITSVFFFAGILCLLSNCSKIKNGDQWEGASIDADILQDPIYQQLDKENEVFSLCETQDSLMRKTSNVSYFSGKRIDPIDTQYAKFNNCRAYFYESDTLSINIGIGNCFGGQGFVINYKNKTFYTEAYFSTDVVIEGEVEPTHGIIYQKLTLDKANYAVGDSLFGYIEFKSIEMSSEGERTEHFGQGNFRTKVSKF